DRATRYGDPLDCARRWCDEGATALHVVNLDGAFGASQKNAELIRALIRETGAYIELGGGIRSLGDAAGWLDSGVDRVILSTFAVEQPDSLRWLSREYGPERVMAGVDSRGTEIVVAGWREAKGNYLRWAEVFVEMGAGSLLYTNVSVEGLQRGIDPAPVRALLETVPCPVVVAGGITSTADLRALHGLGAAGAVLGSALYSGRIGLAEALEAAR
ncbi:MAG TPA: 1-(5-phosphoribosyl)-5-[(5-phosphoribosylamino)methylideneamino]imidazole-4-carboxamide isomerase, partial [Methanoregulaceae archaeon]|nr:1-(5-phosphoribosyl)-5-[(5-phosphoribosylamino)methylideneamino]imidazole-4-carboxamide isomerase [Methanoregulaceae archaeon]